MKATHEILTHWIQHIIGDMELLPTDIITLINKAWVDLFSELYIIKPICITWLVSIQSKYFYAQANL